MPRKARYWANVEHHRKAARDRARRIALLAGNWHDGMYTPEAQETRKAGKRAYGAKHRKIRAANSRKWRKKVTRMFGTSGKTGCWQFKMWRAEKVVNKRKRALALLS